jgi:glycosyltransferase involved in cell wall biosynthesis
MKISVIVGFRNREMSRLVYALDALSNQNFTDFELIFIDYGSDEAIAQQAETLVGEYSFARYYYSNTKGWFWNRAHALNTGVRLAKGDIILFFDIDLIVEKDFLQKIALLDYKSNFYTFSCFYLPEHFNHEQSVLDRDGIHFDQNYVGLCAVKKEHVFAVHGFDEYFMVWGVEDDDIYKRLCNFGKIRVQMMAFDFMVFHQWHPLQSPRKPSFWYLQMMNYYITKNSSSSDTDLGILSTSSRLAKKIFESESYRDHKKIELSSVRIILTFHSFFINFFSLKPGEIVWFEHLIENAYQSNFNNLVDKLNRILSIQKTINYRIVPKEKIEEKSVITTDEIIQFIELFIGVNRNHIMDYYYHKSENRLCLILIKK